MFKLLIALSVFLAIQGQLPGGYTSHPELVKSAVTRNMVKLAVIELARTENVLVTPIDVVSVETQVVNGQNFRIIFTAGENSSGDVRLCTSVIYQSFNGAQSVSHIKCV
jgi:hypothetical protein